MKQAARQVLASPEFRRLVTRRRVCAGVLTLALFVIYYGYIVLVAMEKPLMSRPLGGSATIGIVAGAAVIVASWALAAVYVAWANRVHDPAVRELRDRIG